MPRDKKTEGFEIGELPALDGREMEFVRLLSQGKSASDCYRQAFDAHDWQPNSVWTEASALKSRPEVSLWLQALTIHGMAEASCSLERHLQDLLALREESRATGNYGAAAQCEVARGKVMQLYVDRVQHETADPRELAERIRKVAPELAEQLERVVH